MSILGRVLRNGSAWDTKVSKNWDTVINFVLAGVATVDDDDRDEWTMILFSAGCNEKKALVAFLFSGGAKGDVPDCKSKTSACGNVAHYARNISERKNWWDVSLFKLQMPRVRDALSASGGSKKIVRISSRLMDASRLRLHFVLCFARSCFEESTRPGNGQFLPSMAADLFIKRRPKLASTLRVRRLDFGANVFIFFYLTDSRSICVIKEKQ